MRIATRVLLMLLALVCMPLGASPPPTAVTTQARQETFTYDVTAHNAPARAIETIESRGSVQRHSEQTAMTSRGTPFLARAGVATEDVGLSTRGLRPAAGTRVRPEGIPTTGASQVLGRRAGLGTTTPPTRATRCASCRAIPTARTRPRGRPTSDGNRTVSRWMPSGTNSLRPMIQRPTYPSTTSTSYRSCSDDADHRRADRGCAPRAR